MFEEAGGNISYDSSGNSYTGTLFGGVTETADLEQIQQCSMKALQTTGLAYTSNYFNNWQIEQELALLPETMFSIQTYTGHLAQ